MLIRNFSDLHLDCDAFFAKAIEKRTGTPHKLWYPTKLVTDKETTCVLPGDLWNGNRIVQWKGESWISKIAEQFKYVVVVFGNHDYWGENVDYLHKSIREKIEALGINNVFILENSKVELDGIKFLGATLWTNMNKRDPMTVHAAPMAMQKDFRKIRKGPTYAKIKNFDQLHMHDESVHFITAELAAEPNKKTIVVTHMAPCELSIDPDFKHEYISNGFYYSDLSNLILDNPQIIIWFHGHIHKSLHYVLGNSTMICNPRGYIGYKLNDEFHQDVIDTDDYGKLL